MVPDQAYVGFASHWLACLDGDRDSGAETLLYLFRVGMTLKGIARCDG
ncbi:hypothetical protein PC1_2408 [Pectobacterium carotovorum subsp. carotovorum PC1]|uniref:Uncharacterized protein n=1 Tax=Pectobacterium carotovorum subsp. carotovorum (strain PC1) TaxID=561230 RepID=C6DK56_PECCP|nr:hypothetical protein PC1_2408 [Pectobacterium carotovorum subsp. carotovorum PC1]